MIKTDMLIDAKYCFYIAHSCYQDQVVSAFLYSRLPFKVFEDVHPFFLYLADHLPEKITDKWLLDEYTHWQTTKQTSLPSIIEIHAALNRLCEAFGVELHTEYSSDYYRITSTLSAGDEDVSGYLYVVIQRIVDMYYILSSWKKLQLSSCLSSKKAKQTANHWANLLHLASKYPSICKALVGLPLYPFNVLLEVFPGNGRNVNASSIFELEKIKADLSRLGHEDIRHLFIEDAILYLHENGLTTNTPYDVNVLANSLIISKDASLEMAEKYDTTHSFSIKRPNENKEGACVFDLPDSLFKDSTYPVDQKNAVAHYLPDFDIQKHGGAKFAELINTISLFGYISPTTRNKKLLTYVLTGRCKPDDYQEGEKVEWIDSGYGYELLYVVKYIIGNVKGKYMKAKKLFNGPKWLGKGEFKDQADYAKADFRKALNAIYPDECIVKGHVETVKEPEKRTEWGYIPENINKDL